MSPRSTPDAPRKREADPRVQRYAMAKRAAHVIEVVAARKQRLDERFTKVRLKYETAREKLNAQAETAWAAQREAAETATTPEEKAYLLSLGTFGSVGSGEPKA